MVVFPNKLQFKWSVHAKIRKAFSSITGGRKTLHGQKKTYLFKKHWLTIIYAMFMFHIAYTKKLIFTE